jgi:transcriptional regulator with XRE-family HTH domain
MRDSGNRIRELREAKGISGTKLAEMIGISPQYLYDLERGDKRLNEEIIVRLTEALGVTADYLLGLGDKPQSSLRPTKDPGLTIAAHRRGDFYEELPDEAKRQIDEYVEFIIQKHKKRKEEK